MSSEFLAQSVREVLGLDDESIQQIVQNAESLKGDELRSFLEGFVGDVGIIDTYLTKRFPPQKPKNPKEQAQPAVSASSSSQGATRQYDPRLNFVPSGVWDKPESKKQTGKKDGKKSSNQNNQVKVDSLGDIDSALKQLELASSGRSRCNCMAQRHPLLEVAPNCLNCGKIICVKEGLGRCTFCGEDLISSDQMSSINQILRMEKQQISSSMGKKARQRAGYGETLSDTLSNHQQAEQQLNQLLEYQDTSAQRTKIIDQVSDFEMPGYGTNVWASPMEQAQQMKRQQRQLRKMEQAQKSRQGRGKKVISIDVRGNKVYSKEEEVVSSESEDEEEESQQEPATPPASKKKSVVWNPADYGKNFIKPKSDVVVEGKTKNAARGGVVDFDEERALEM